MQKINFPPGEPTTLPISLSADKLKKSNAQAHFRSKLNVLWGVKQKLKGKISRNTDKNKK